MNNTEPLNVTQDPNMLDDVVRFYESLIKQDEADWVRSPIMSTFLVDEVWNSIGIWWPFPRFTPSVDSFGTVSMQPLRSTQRTTTSIFDWFKQVLWYRALKTWRHIIESDITITPAPWQFAPSTAWLRLRWVNNAVLDWHHIIRPRRHSSSGVNQEIPLSTYRAVVYMRAYEFFILQAMINAWVSRWATIKWQLSVLAIEDLISVWQT